jgi:signal transduction histidine kinase
MTRFSQLKFSRKIFLAIFGTATGAALIICLFLYGTLSTFRFDEFEDSYVDHMNLLGKALARVEEAQSRIALNAALNVKLNDQLKKGKLSSADLQGMVQNFGVNRINIYDNQGQALSYSDTKPPLLALAGLEMGPQLQFQTPLTKGADGQVGQHTLISSQDGKRVIEVVLYFDHVTQLLREMAQHDEDNLSMELMGPQGESLGLIERPDYKGASNNADILKHADGAIWSSERMIVLTTIKQADLAKNYRLITTISTRALKLELRKIQTVLLSSFALLLILSWVLSKLLTKTLLRRVESIRGLLGNITRTQEYSERIEISSSDSQDEIEDLGQKLNLMLETLQSHQKQIIEAVRDKARSQVAAQVAHDIRSPLMSMNMALGQIESSQLEPLAILKSAVARLAGIVQKLSAVSAKPDEAPGAEAPKLTLMEPLIASVVNEHSVRKTAKQKLNFTGFNKLPNIWSVVQVVELQTAISNLINNAFEAGATDVSLDLSEQPKTWTLAIKDNGNGIPAHVLGQIFERSFTHGKKTGTGLGLFQAKSAIEWSGGTLEVATSEGQGTTFTVSLPKEKKPNWFPASIEVALDQSICFMDDDQNVLDCWKAKAQELGLKQAHFFRSTGELLKWSKLSAWPETALLVTDQNLGEDKKGLDILAELAIGKRGFLCTSEFDEKWVQDQVRKLNGNLIPKPWISQFELKVRTS